MKADPREKFVELAQKRVNKAINDIRLVGNLSNRSNYSYTEQDSKKIYAALRRAVDEMRARFDRRGAGHDDVFKL
ncbi:MAG: hypothetical protein J0M16_01375 [Gammaproteobacteria bacterium]|nr:hypothetical protein [Gammaproteobacteria bacterium]